MNKDEHIQQLTDAAFNSTDNMDKASPKPFLLSRIQARLSAKKETGWGRAAAFIARPAVLVPAFFMIVLLNAAAIFYQEKKANTGWGEQSLSMPADDFSTTVVTMYETDNP